MASRADASDANAGFGELLGRSAVMRQLFAEAAEVARADTPICVSGEAGTGKDALGRALHRASPRSQGPFVTVDCSGPKASVESELFGRTASDPKPRPGAIDLARGGTLLLDHCCELPCDLQAALAMALSSRRSVSEQPALEPRTIAASRSNFARELERGRLHPALYGALGGAELSIPPLRERRDDIPLIAQQLLGRMEEARGVALSAEALELLSLHDWPGNVRELRNVIERFVFALRQGDPSARKLGPLLLGGELPAIERRERAGGLAAEFEPGASYREERARFEGEFERNFVAWLLERHDGNLSAAARAADMDRKYLDKLARKHGLKPVR
jgi:DNA-binding NtrC family response regulator